MSKYIDIDKLKTEIERRKNEWQALIDKDNAVSAKTVQELICEDTNILQIINSLQQNKAEIGLEKFTQKMDDWKARYDHPDNIPIKATMAFTARMFYMYPDVARQWYDSLPKATMDEQNNEK